MTRTVAINMALPGPDRQGDPGAMLVALDELATELVRQLGPGRAAALVECLMDRIGDAETDAALKLHLAEKHERREAGDGGG